MSIGLTPCNTKRKLINPQKKLKRNYIQEIYETACDNCEYYVSKYIYGLSEINVIALLSC